MIPKDYPPGWPPHPAKEYPPGWPPGYQVPVPKAAAEPAPVIATHVVVPIAESKPALQKSSLALHVIIWKFILIALCALFNALTPSKKGLAFKVNLG